MFNHSQSDGRAWRPGRCTQELARSANLPPLLVLAIANEQDAAARGLAALSGMR